MSISSQVLIGLGLGIFTGLFLGELVSPVKVVGQIFLNLLMMTVLPYVMVSLIAGLGRLTVEDAKRLAVKGGKVLLVFWTITLATVAVVPLAFRPLESPLQILSLA